MPIKKTVRTEIEGAASLAYPVTLKKEGQSVLVSFRDIPEALTLGDSEKEALHHAADALETALDFYFDAGQAVPMPSAAKRGQRLVDLPASVASRVLAWNESLRKRG